MFSRATEYVAHSRATTVYFLAFLGCLLLTGLLWWHEDQVIQVRAALADYTQNNGQPLHPVTYNQTIEAFAAGSNAISYFLVGWSILLSAVLIISFCLGGGDE